MIASNARKLHPEFDLAVAQRIYAESGHDQDIDGESITSPHDLFSVEELRDRLGLRVGDAVPTDVFVFGKGESERRDCTKVGGKPYWPSDRSWPTSANGVPYQFLAQFNFADSMDLVGELPGAVLLLLVAEGEDWLSKPNQIHFEWLPLGLTPITDFDASLAATKAGPFFGAIYRSADFPDADEKAYASKVSQSYNLPILNGTKIGGLPHFIQSGDDIGGEFICQLGSIQAAPYAPYPWINHATALGLEFDERGIYGDENSILFGDMGSIYFFRDARGQMRSSFECH